MRNKTKHSHTDKVRRNTFLSSFLTITLFTIISGCNVYNDISATADSATDFSVYHTFAWLPDQTDTGVLPFNNEIIRNNIRNYVGQGFAERGYKVDLDTPDILLGIVITNKRMQKTVIYPTYPYPYYYRRYYYGSVYYYPYPYDYYYHHHRIYHYPPAYSAQRYEYLESSITLYIIDRKLNRMIWSGTAKGDVYDPVYVNKDIHPAVEAIMKKYPVKPIDHKQVPEKKEVDLY